MSAATNHAWLAQAFEAEKKGRFPGACELARKVIANDAPPGATSLDASLLLGKLLTYQGPPAHAEAESVLKAARALAEAQKKPRAAAAAVHGLALLERQRRNLDAALALLAESPVAMEAALPSAARAQWLHYHGLVAQSRSEINGAERYYLRALEVYEEARERAGVAEVCDSLANLLIRRGKLSLALDFARRSLEEKKRLGDLYGQAVSHGTLGRAYQLRGDFEDAARAYQADLDLVRAQGFAGEGLMLNNLGEVALLSKDLAKAESYYRQALAVDRSPNHLAHAHLGLARVLLAADRVDEADREGEAAEAVLLANPHLRGLPHVLRGLRGSIAWRRGDLAAGEAELKAAIDGLKAEKLQNDTLPMLYELRDLYQARESRAEAVRVMHEALNLLNECGSDRGVEDVEEWLRGVDTPKLVRLALEQYIPEWVVQEAIEGRLRQPPNRKLEVTILFSDIQGFTPLTKDLGPDQIVEFLNEWFAEATRIILKHRGIVDKFIGDAVMAIFGLPEPYPEAAADAVRAALEMRDALAAINMRQKALGKPSIGVGIGLASGEAVVGMIGSHLRRSFTAIGDVVNTAARLEAATREAECDILVTAAVQEVQEKAEVAETRFVGNLALKGREKTPEPAWKVIGPIGGVNATGS